MESIEILVLEISEIPWYLFCFEGGLGEFGGKLKTFVGKSMNFEECISIKNPIKIMDSRGSRHSSDSRVTIPFLGFERTHYDPDCFPKDFHAFHSSRLDFSA